MDTDYLKGILMGTGIATTLATLDSFFLEPTFTLSKARYLTMIGLYSLTSASVGFLLCRANCRHVEKH